jgi:hypothetical protein
MFGVKNKMPVCKAGFEWIQELCQFGGSVREILVSWKESNPDVARKAHAKLHNKRPSAKQAHVKKVLKNNSSFAVECSEDTILQDDLGAVEIDSDDLANEDSILLN